ncbi:MULTISPECIES: response regulator transcription factor [Flavobacteriaceae]|uniref:response regulator transcription factor n=1 Tax=Flavobacteriaceae TaxID=49546 RepID=UPI00149275B2|nr:MULTISPECIES: response regulator transcription factor [Allomuricauda]MDC6365787.1 response regulator transcription factor [Muricauda sp. AC10]
MSRPIKIVLAEDEPALGQIVKESLETRNFEVILCADGIQAMKSYQQEKPELLVIDVMMPKKDGFTLAQEIREENKDIPIIFLTAKSQTQDVVNGFQLGGNDYLKKPFSMEELIVRIHALLDRAKTRQSNQNIMIGEYSFNYTKQILTFEEEKQNLTHREAELLYHLSQKRNEILDRSQILKKLWGDDDFFNARSMDVFISKLRKKLAKDPSVKIINVRGYGYKLVC